MSLDRDKISRKKRSEVWAKTNGFCFYCGSKLDPFISFCIDHIVPITKNGQGDIDNLVPCCRSCNSRKQNRSLEKFRALLAPVRFTEKQISYLKSRGLKEQQFLPEPFVFFFEKQKVVLISSKTSGEKLPEVQ